MAEQNELFQLIKSLNRNEKGYFRKFTKLNSENEDNNYLRLFDAIDAQEVYDETEIREFFKEQKFVQQLHVTKNYLFKLILKSLRNYNSTTTASIQINELLTETEVLISKQMFKAAKKHLQKARKLALESCKNNYLPIIQRWEDGLHIANRFQDIDDHEFNSFRQSFLETFDDIKTTAEYEMLYAQLIRLYAKKRTVKNPNDKLEFDAIVQHPLIANPPKSIGLYTKMVRLDLLAFYYSANADQKTYAEVNDQILKLLSAHPEYTHHVPYSLIHALQNTINAYTAVGNFAEVPALINRLSALKPRFERDRISQAAVLLNVQISYYLRTGQFSDAKNYIETNSAHIEKVLAALPAYSRYGQKLKLAAIYIFSKDYDKALLHINQILQAKEIMQFSLYEEAKVWSVIAHYELKNYALMPHLLLSLTRLLIRKKRHTPFEQVFLQNFRKLSSLKNEQDILHFLKRFHEDLKSTISNNPSFITSEQKEISLWLAHKAQV
ncbi:MAG: hypothetical protein SFW35_03585 [Chitinophagales bacterium]|nr:hypothetical protein [Chitinophagales bacterium]